MRSSRAAVGEQELDRPVEALGLHRRDRLADVALLVEHGHEHADVHALVGRRRRGASWMREERSRCVHYAVAPPETGVQNPPAVAMQP